MYYAPYYYNDINVQAGTYNPSPVKSFNNKTFAFWQRSLIQRAMSTIELDIPDNWNGSVRDFLYYCMFRWGYVVVSNDPEYGYFFQPASLKGFNFYYQPVTAIIANPLMQRELKLSEDGELLKLTPDFIGAWDIVSYYAEKLSTLDNAINMSLINNKFAFFLGAKNKNAASALKKMMDLVNKGQPMVVWDQKITNDPNDKEFPFQEWQRDLKHSYITTDQLMDFQTILNNFDAEVGIPTIPYQKKERMVTSEADSRQIDSSARSLVWFDSLTNSIDNIKELYPDIKLSATMRYKLDQEEGDTDETDTDRSL